MGFNLLRIVLLNSKLFFFFFGVIFWQFLFIHVLPIAPNKSTRQYKCFTVTVKAEIFGRILFLRIALNDIFAM